MKRSEKLMQSVEAFWKIHVEWREGANRGTRPESPDEVYWREVDSLLQLWNRGDIPHSCRKLNDAVVRFEQEVKKYDERQDYAKSAPMDSFWGAVEHLNKTLESTKQRVSLPPLEPVKELRSYATPVSYQQICQMYGWKTANGQWDIGKAKEEELHPGKHTGPESGWVDPRLQEMQDSEEESDEEYYEPEDDAPAACPETLTELIDQFHGEPNPQIARMKGIGMDELRKACEVRKAELEALENETESQGEDADVSELVILASSEGRTSQEIAAELGISVQKAAAIVRAHHKREAAAT